MFKYSSIPNLVSGGKPILLSHISSIKSIQLLEFTMFTHELSIQLADVTMHICRLPYCAVARLDL